MTKICPICQDQPLSKFGETCSRKCGQQLRILRRGPRPCEDCGAPVLSGAVNRPVVCAEDLVARSKARGHKKNALRQGATSQGASDVTPEYLACLRKRAKRCPMPGCCIRMVDGGLKPASKELDHIIPINVGGTHTIGNVRFICRLCNEKRPKDGRDFVGQPTLWAQDAQILKATPPHTPRHLAGCGHKVSNAAAALRARCTPCNREYNQQRADAAARMRASGMRLREVAAALGYANEAGAFFAAQRSSLNKVTVVY